MACPHVPPIKDDAFSLWHSQFSTEELLAIEFRGIASLSDVAYLQNQRKIAHEAVVDYEPGLSLVAVPVLLVEDGFHVTKGPMECLRIVVPDPATGHSIALALGGGFHPSYEFKDIVHDNGVLLETATPIWNEEAKRLCPHADRLAPSLQHLRAP